jgi:amidase
MGSIAHTEEPYSWQTKVAEKQQQSQAAIPEAWQLPDSIVNALAYPLEEKPNRLIELDIPRKSGILSEKELDITEQNTVAQLLAKLASGEFTSLEVTTAFCKRAAIAQQLVNAASPRVFIIAVTWRSC